MIHKCDAPLSSQMDSTASPKVNSERRRNWGAFFGSPHFKGRRVCWRSEMGLRRLTSNSITHTNLHKPNNKLVSEQLEHFGAWMNHEQPRTYNTHHSPNFGEATTFLLLIYFVPGHGTNTQMSFCPENPGIPTIGTLVTLGAHNFVYKPLIEMTSKTKLQPSLKAFQQYIAHHLYARKLG